MITVWPFMEANLSMTKEEKNKSSKQSLPSNKSKSLPGKLENSGNWKPLTPIKPRFPNSLLMKK